MGVLWFALLLLAEGVTAGAASIWKCRTEWNDEQLWSIEGDHSIRLANKRLLCLTAHGNNSALTVEACEQPLGVHQVWKVHNGGKITPFESPTLCASPSQFGRKDGTPIWLEGCDGWGDQSWNIVGGQKGVRLTGADTWLRNQCLTVRGPHKKMNFIFYMPDEMRAESVGCYGHKQSKTPNFDKFAAQGTRFEQCHTAYTVCSQSRTSMMTGWYPHVRGHRTLWHLLRPDEPNLLKYLKQDGYTVKWWGKNDLLATASFNASVTSASSSGGSNGGGNPYNSSDPRFFSFLNEPFKGKVEDTKEYRNVQAAIDFLASNPPEPWAIYLPLIVPHPPYACPEPWYSSVDPDSLPPLRPANLTGKPDYHELIRRYRRLDQIPDADAFFRKLQAVYMGSISFTDFLFGRLMSALDSSVYAGSTTVAVFADHGDYAGDYHLVEKWPSGLEDVLTRIPLIMRTPGGAPAHVVQGQVQLMDLVATVLELANVVPEHTHWSHSLVVHLLGNDPEPDRAVFAEGGYSSNEPRNFEGWCQRSPIMCNPDFIYYPKGLQQQEHPLSVCRSTMIRTRSHKLVWRTDPLDNDHDSELYDLVKDPQELHNVYGQSSYLAIQHNLTISLLQWMVQTSDVTPFNDDPRNLPTDSVPDVFLDTRNPDNTIIFG